MKNAITTLEDARAHYVGKVIHDKKIVDVASSYIDNSGKRRWIVIARCPHCGNLFEKKLQTLAGSPRTSCGCQDNRRGSAWRDAPLLFKKSLHKEEDKPTHRSRRRLSTPDAVKEFTKGRMRAYWDELTPALLCLAWRDFEKFYDWAIRNGYAHGRTLEWFDRTKLMSPLTCRWSEESITPA